MRIASQNRYDVVIVGARVAGAATAMLPARLGARRGGRGPGVIPQRHHLDATGRAQRRCPAAPLGPAGCSQMAWGGSRWSDQPEFAVVTHGDSVAALEAFAGPRWQEAVIEPEEEHMPAQVFCDHYETTETGAMMANRPIR